MFFLLKKKKLKKKVVPGLEPGLFESKSNVITTTLYNRMHILSLRFLEYNNKNKYIKR